METKLYDYIFDDDSKICVECPLTKVNASKRTTAFTKSTYLDLSNHGLNEFNPSHYSHLADIKYLYLKNNNLRFLDPDLFKTFPNLVWIDLRNNQLESFPSTVCDAPRLTQILLENNDLQEIPLDVGGLKHLKGIQVRGNPLLSPLREIVENEPKKVVDYLKNLWKESKGIQTNETHEKDNDSGGVKNSRRYSILNKKRKQSPIKRRSLGVLDDYFFNESVRSALDMQEKFLQRKRDIECLKDWRKHYNSVPAIGSIDLPPFELDERYTKLPNREDLQNFDLHSPRRKIEGKVMDINKEVHDIKKTLQEIQSASLVVSNEMGDIKQLKDSKKNEISKLKVLQKRLEDLKMKH